MTQSAAPGILLPCLLNFYAEYIMQNEGVDESQSGTKVTRRNTNNLRHADDTSQMTENEDELKSLLMRVKEEWKSSLETQNSKN